MLKQYEQIPFTAKSQGKTKRELCVLVVQVGKDSMGKVLILHPDP